MDPFQLRIECLGLVRRLTASQQSIAKVVDFLVKHAGVAADDMWDCVLGECGKTSLNARLNILFLIDALVLSVVDPSGVASSSAAPKPAQASGSVASTSTVQAASSYAQRAARDLDRIIEAVVPSDGWDAVRLNASSTQKVLASWKLLGFFSADVLDAHERKLQARKTELSGLPSAPRASLSQADILRRIEEDRERHKRLRERAWILPPKTFAGCLHARPLRHGIKPSPKSPKPHALQQQRLAKSSSGSTASAGSRAPDANDVDFEQMWETTSDLNEDDFEQMRDDDAAWWGGTRFAEEQHAKAELVAAATLAPPLEAAVEKTPADQHEHVAEPALARKREADEGDRDQEDRSRDRRRRDEERETPNRWRRIGDAGSRTGGFKPVGKADSGRSEIRRRDDEENASRWSRRDYGSRRDEEAYTSSRDWASRSAPRGWR